MPIVAKCRKVCYYLLIGNRERKTKCGEYLIVRFMELSRRQSTTLRKRLKPLKFSEYQRTPLYTKREALSNLES
jgi:hypothetical protein